MPDFDAIAIGGGLAGSAFALELARQGKRVAIIERTSAAQLKVCGDFLSCEAQDLLSYLGLDVMGLGATQVSTLRLAAGERTACASLPFKASGLSRLRIDEALLAEAQTAGAEVIRGEAVTAFEPSTGSVKVHVGERAYVATCAALATGKHNVRGWPRAQGSMTAFKVMVELAPSGSRALDDVVQLVTYRGGYIGACNVEDGLATLCWLMDARAMKEVGPEWPAHLSYIARQSSHFGDLLEGAKFLSERPAAISAIPYGYQRRAVIARNVFPIGDQLSVIPSYTGDGTSLALSSGLAAARAVISGQAAADFQKASLARIGPQFFWAGAAERAFKSPLAQAISITAMSLVPQLAGLVAGLTRVRGVEALTRTQGR